MKIILRDKEIYLLILSIVFAVFMGEGNFVLTIGLSVIGVPVGYVIGKSFYDQMKNPKKKIKIKLR